MFSIAQILLLTLQGYHWCEERRLVLPKGASCWSLDSSRAGFGQKAQLSGWECLGAGLSKLGGPNRRGQPTGHWNRWRMKGAQHGMGHTSDNAAPQRTT